MINELHSTPNRIPALSTSNLCEFLDAPVWISLFDGTDFVGIFSSYDHIGNVILRDASKRFFHHGQRVTVPGISSEDNQVTIKETQITMYADKREGLAFVAKDNIKFIAKLESGLEESSRFLVRTDYEKLRELMEEEAKEATEGWTEE